MKKILIILTLFLSVLAGSLAVFLFRQRFELRRGAVAPQVSCEEPQCGSLTCPAGYNDPGSCYEEKPGLCQKRKCKQCIKQGYSEGECQDADLWLQCSDHTPTCDGKNPGDPCGTGEGTCVEACKYNCSSLYPNCGERADCCTHFPECCCGAGTPVPTSPPADGCANLRFSSTGTIPNGASIKIDVIREDGAHGPGCDDGTCRTCSGSCTISSSSPSCSIGNLDCGKASGWSDLCFNMTLTTSYGGTEYCGFDAHFENDGKSTCDQVLNGETLPIGVVPEVTPCVTNTPPPEGSCRFIRFYKTDCSQITQDQLPNLQVGQTVWIAVSGLPTENFDKGRIRINASSWWDTDKDLKRDHGCSGGEGVFYVECKVEQNAQQQITICGIPYNAERRFTAEGMVHHVTQGWK